MTLQYRPSDGAVLACDDGAIMGVCSCKEVVCADCPADFPPTVTASLSGFGLWAVDFNGSHQLNFGMAGDECVWSKGWDAGEYHYSVAWIVSAERGISEVSVGLDRAFPSTHWHALLVSGHVEDICVFTGGGVYAGCAVCLPRYACEEWEDDARAVVS